MHSDAFERLHIMSVNTDVGFEHVVPDKNAEKEQLHRLTHFIIRVMINGNMPIQITRKVASKFLEFGRSKAATDEIKMCHEMKDGVAQLVCELNDDEWSSILSYTSYFTEQVTASEREQITGRMRDLDTYRVFENA